ncbi:MAG: SCO family protein [Proteobacteria bacterium]|nr:SCO family protein [Pseudomonadota bacterium]
MSDILCNTLCKAAGRRRLFLCSRASLLVVLILLFVYDDVRSAEINVESKPVAGEVGADETPVGIVEQLDRKIPLDITFRDEGGKPVRLADLVTGPTIILPVYFSCTNECYTLQWGLAQVLPKLKNKPDEEYRVISVSFDEHDTPELAAKFKRVYLTSMHVPFPASGWRFLTGDVRSIKRLTNALGYTFQRRGRDFLHPVASIVISGNGTIVRYLYGATFLPKDLALALIEAREGKSSTAVRKVLQYCFSYDPRQNTYVFNLLRVSATVVIVCTGGFLAFLLLSGRKRNQPDSRKK